MLIQDYELIEKLAHQNRERIPERTVHAKGWGAHGTLTVTSDVSKYTKAKALQPAAKTPCFPVSRPSPAMRSRIDTLATSDVRREAPYLHEQSCVSPVFAALCDQEFHART